MTSTSRTAALSAAVVVAGLIAVPLATATDASAAASATEADFGFASGYQTWTVPPGVTTVAISVVGGAGGDGAVVDSTCSGSNYGAAGWVTGTVPVTPGQVLSLWVGGGGHLSGAGGAGTPDQTWAGGAGGAAGFGFTATGGAGNGGGGGGASVVWRSTARGDDDILLVGGGGGGGGGEGPAVYECGGFGGNGGRPASNGGSPSQASVDLSGLAGQRAGSDHNALPGATPQSFGAGGGGGGAGVDIGEGGRTDETASGTAGGGGGGTSFARDGVVTGTFFSSSGAHGSNGSISITWGAPTSTSIGSGTADVGSTVPLRAFVEPSDGGGTVRFTSDGTVIPGCGALGFASGGGDTWEAACDTSSLPAGVHEIAASYSGDTAYAGSASSGFWTIRQPTTTTVTTSPQNPAAAGDALALDAVIGRAYGGGTVAFDVDGTTVPGCSAAPVRQVQGAWSATCSTTAPAVGVHTVGAAFSGDSVDYASSGSAPVQVGTSAPITGTVITAPGAPTLGTVQAGDGSVTVDFTAPAFDGDSPITSYLVVATPTGGGTPVSATTTTHPFTLTGLADRTAYTVTVAATNAIGTGPASAASAPVTPVAPLAVTTASLPSGTVGTPYTTTLTASGGTGDVSWTLATGSSLPAGLALNTDGTLTGTPTAAVAGRQFGVHVADVSGQTADARLSITVAAPPAADLRVTLTPAGTFRSGSTGSFQLQVADVGTAATSGRITAGLLLPFGLMATAAGGNGWSCHHGLLTTCTRTATIAAGASSTITVQVRVIARPGRTLVVGAGVLPTDATPADDATTQTVHIG